MKTHLLLIPTLALSLAACGGEKKYADGHTDADHAALAEHEHKDPDHDGMAMGNSAPAPGDSEATKGFKNSMAAMMSSAPPYSGDADVDFSKQMRGHHQAAINMAKVELANGKDPEMRKLATAIVEAQQREIAQIDGWLAKKGSAAH